jgi:benzoylformate decarboxylase
MPVMTGKTAFMEMLRAEGVRYIFGNPGTSELAIMSALEEYQDIRYVLAAQEGVAMGMADGYSIGTGQPSLVNLHIDSGLANGISLLQHAMDGGVPIILTAGNKDSRKLAEGRTDLPGMVAQFTKWSAEVTNPQQIPGAMRRAFNEAKTLPTGPVFLAFSFDAFDGEADVTIVPSAKQYHRIAPDREAVEDAAKILAASSNPMILVGDRLGMSGGVDQAVALAEMLGARVYATSYARMNFPTGHPQFLGRVNPVLPAARDVFAPADVILAVGTNVFSGFFYFPGSTLKPGTRLIHLDSSAKEVGKSEPTDVGIVADPKIGLEQLMDAVGSVMTGQAKEAAKGRAAAVAGEKKALRAAWRLRLKERWDHRPMPVERMMAELAKVLPKDTVFADDTITSRDALHGAFEFSGPDSIFSERGGAIGWGMGSALGLKLAFPGRPVVGVLGDGSAMMTVQGLWTAANEDLPVVYIICNNRSYRILKLNMNIYQSQLLQWETPASQYLGMDFGQPFDIAAIANAMGVYGQSIDDPAELGPAVEKALASGKPAVLDVAIDGSV